MATTIVAVRRWNAQPETRMAPVQLHATMVLKQFARVMLNPRRHGRWGPGLAGAVQGCRKSHAYAARVDAGGTCPISGQKCSKHGSMAGMPHSCRNTWREVSRGVDTVRTSQARLAGPALLESSLPHLGMTIASSRDGAGEAECAGARPHPHRDWLQGAEPSYGFRFERGPCSLVEQECTQTPLRALRPRRGHSTRTHRARGAKADTAGRVPLSPTARE